MSFLNIDTIYIESTSKFIPRMYEFIEYIGDALMSSFVRGRIMKQSNTCANFSYRCMIAEKVMNIIRFYIS